MHWKFVTPAALALAATLVVADNAAAQQTVNFTLGYFALRGEDARLADDVLLENLNTYDFDVKDLNSASIGGEWLVPIGDFLEAGAGIQYPSRSAPTVYNEYLRQDGSEIEQEMNLRIVPMTATLRILPLSKHAPVQPYVGGGVGIFAWRYREVGDFIDFTPGQGNAIFAGEYEDSGVSVGPVAVFGVRVPLGQFAIGFEGRYQKASGDLNSDFLAPKIDLSGFHYQATFGLRF